MGRMLNWMISGGILPMCVAVGFAPMAGGLSPALDSECPKAAIVDGSFVSAKTCARMSDEQLQLYLIGFIDALELSQVFGANRACLARQIGCVVDERMNSLDLARAVRRTLMEQSDERREIGCNAVVYEVLSRVCGASSH